MKTLLPALATVALFAACGPGANMNNAMNERIAKNIAAVNWFNDNVFNKHNPALVDSILTSDYVEHTPDPGFQPTREGLKMNLAGLFAAFPDISITMHFMFADSDKVCYQSTITGTNTGSFMGMPATGKKITVDGIDVVSLNKDGKGTEHWGYYEQVKMMQQLGMMPDMSAKKDSTKSM